MACNDPKSLEMRAEFTYFANVVWWIVYCLYQIAIWIINHSCVGVGVGVSVGAGVRLSEVYLKAKEGRSNDTGCPERFRKERLFAA